MILLGFQALKEEPPIETDLMGPGSWHTPYSLEASDSGAGVPDGSFESAGNRAMSFDYKEMEPSAHTGSPGHAYSTSLKDWNSLFPGNEACFAERVAVSQPTCSTASSFAEGHANHILDHRDPNVLQGKADVAGKVDSECMLIFHLGYKLDQGITFLLCLKVQYRSLHVHFVLFLKFGVEALIMSSDD